MNTTTLTRPSKLSPGDARHAALVKQTQKWVAQTFYGPVLQSMRNSPFKDKLFSGGRGGEAFQQMFDQKLADHMSASTGNKLVKAVVNKIEANMGRRHGKSEAFKRPAAPVVNSPSLNLRA